MVLTENTHRTEAVWGDVSFKDMQYISVYFQEDLLKRAIFSGLWWEGGVLKTAVRRK